MDIIYLDKFISSKRKYSHGAIYVGDGKIIHAISKGCSYINAIDFMRCDRICILRPKRGITAALKLAKSFNIPMISVFGCLRIVLCGMLSQTWR